MPKNITKTVAVVGATGTQGGATVRSLLKYGYRVRGLTRNTNTDKARSLNDLGVEVVYADLDDAMSLSSALRGADAVFGVTTPFGTNVDIEIAQGKRLVDAAVANRIEHFVFSSVANADKNTGIPHFDSKYQIEEHLRSQPINWTIIAPGAFMDDFLDGWYKKSVDDGKLARPMPADQPLSYICGDDIGAMAALAIHRNAEFYGRRIDIAGDVITGQQIVAILAKLLGKPVGYQEIPLKIAETYSHDLATMFRYFQEAGLAIDIQALRGDYPEIPWHTFSEWATLHIKG